MPEEWAEDAERRHKAKVPEEIAVATKPQIAIALLRELKETGALPPLAIADAAYGVNGTFRRDLQALGLDYVVGIVSTLKVWAPGVEPPPVPAYSGTGRPPVRRLPDEQHRPVSVKALTIGLPQRRYRQVTWREGTNAALCSRFAALRVRCAKREGERAELEPAQWLLIEWPNGASEPEKYFLRTLPAATPVRELVRLAKLRWRIERDYQELKQELGLGQFEGRSWRGFHHHASLCIAAYGFLAGERIAAPEKTPHHPIFAEIAALPEDYRPRGSPERSTPSARFDRDITPRTGRTTHCRSRSMSVLRSKERDHWPTQ